MITGNATNNTKAKKANESGNLYAEFGLAVGHHRRETSFINVVAFAKLAEWAEKHVTKGRQYAVVGRMEGRSGRAKVIADRIDFQDYPLDATGTQEDTPAKEKLRATVEEVTSDTRTD